MTFSFDKLRKQVMKRAHSDSFEAVQKGNEREVLVEDVLEEMKREKTILDYAKSGKFGIGDIKDGVDFYIVVMKKERVVIPIQVTGFQFLEEHNERHPDVPLVCVPDAGNRRAQVKLKIMLIVNNW